jgi:hypothetical protein
MNDNQNDEARDADNGGTSGLLRQSAQARTSRRNLLRRGSVAAVASVAGLTVLDQHRAEAVTGDALVLGSTNDADNPTQLHVTTAAITLVPLFHIDGTGLSGTSTSMIVDGPGSPQGIALEVNASAGGTGIKTSAAKDPQGTTGLALAASGSNGADAIHASSDKGAGVAAASTSGRGVTGTSGSNTGVAGASTSGKGVTGTSGSNTGVAGASTSGKGVTGTSGSNTGVAGASTSGKGVIGASGSNTGVAGTSSAGTGVTGTGKRGGVFSGSAAAIRLTPHAGGHPTSGSKGDLFVDHNAHLWFCRGGTDWVKLA